MRFFEILFSFIAGASCQANDFLDGKCLCFLEHAFRFLEFINTGTYVCRLRSSAQQQTRRQILTKDAPQ